MRNLFPARWAALALWLLLAGAACAQAGADPNTIALTGPSGSRTLTADDLAKLPRMTVTDTAANPPAEYEGVAFSELLKLVGAPLGQDLKGDKLAWIVTIRAADGYRVVYALAEMDPPHAGRTVMLADRRDGKPLPAAIGPYRIVALGDKRPARWVRQVTSISVRPSE